MPDVKQRILKFVSRASYRPLQERQLARRLGVQAADRDAFSQAIRELRQSGRMSIGHRGQLRCHAPRNTITGIVRRMLHLRKRWLRSPLYGTGSRRNWLQQVSDGQILPWLRNESCARFIAP